jgi:uroporphyrinogen decarboxylase
MSHDNESTIFRPHPDYHRVLTALQLHEPDRVPIVEMGHDRIIKDQFMARPVRDIATDVDFWYKTGYDFAYYRAAYEFPFTMPLNVATGTGLDLEADDIEAESVSDTEAGVIASMDDFEKYPWPHPDTIDYSNIAEAASCLPDGMGIISGVGGIFTRTWMLMGLERFCIALIENPDLIARIFEKVGSIQCEVLRRIISMEKIFAIWYGDDLAYTESLMVSPSVYRKYLFPWVEELSRISHSADMPFMMHSDGVLWEVIPDLIALGLNALHPIEPKAMDITEVKAKYGHKLAIIGNIDLGSTLVRGTPDEVKAEVKQRIKDLAPGGGYMVGSSAGITRYVPLRNFNALREAAFEYGTYPINLA